MIFNIDVDEGSRITGWVVPDNPGATAKIIIVLPNGEELQLAATVSRPDVVDLGFHHATALVGFVIDEQVIPGLQEIEDIQLLDGEGRVPIYRRYQISRHLEKKLCYYDLSVMPQRRIMQRLGSQFALAYNYAQRYPLETTMMLVNNPNSKSVLISGRPPFMRQYGLLRNAGFIITALLRDPYEELAERLVFINLLANSKASHLLPQFVSDIQPVVDFARELPLDDQKAMVTKFRAITREQRDSMSNPMTRVFACGIDERPEHRHVSTALDNLAGMDAVGVRSRFAEFRSVLTDVLGADVIGQDDLEISEKVQEAREVLAGIGMVSDLLEHDLNLYMHASQAISVGLDGL